MSAEVIASAISAGGGLLGGVISGAGALYGAQQQRNFERDMSNTAHQREVQDLIKAGLNPILSAKGAGASTPQVTAINPGEQLGENIAHAADRIGMDLPKIIAEQNLIKANSAKAEAETRNTDADTLLKLQLGDRNPQIVQKLIADIEATRQGAQTSSAQEKLTREREGLVRQERIILETLVPYLQKGSDAIQQLSDYLTAGGKLGDQAYDLVQEIKKAINKAANSIDAPINSTVDAVKNLPQLIIDTVKKYGSNLMKNFPAPRGEADEGPRGP